MGLIGGWKLGLTGSFPGLVLFSGEQPYIGRGSVREALTGMRDAQLVVLGLEGFATDGSRICPLSNFVADLSEIEGAWASRVAVSYSAALHILDSWGAAAPFIQITAITRDD